MKIKKSIADLFSLIILLVCGLGCMEYNQIKPPPPGYKILCNLDSTKFIVQMPGGTKLYKWGHLNEAYRNYKDAVNKAWEQYNFIMPSPDTTKWIKYRDGQSN